jgi:hypothetical protein
VHQRKVSSGLPNTTRHALMLVSGWYKYCGAQSTYTAHISSQKAARRSSGSSTSLIY